MTEQSGTGASKEFLESRNVQEGGDINLVSSESILAALNLCLKSNIEFNEQLFKQVGGVGPGM